MPRQTAESCTVFSLAATDYLGELEEVTVSITISDEDGAAINETWFDSCAVGREWTASGSAFVDDAPELMATAISNNPVVAVVLTINGTTYGGNALLSTASHETKRKSLQKQQFTLKGKGALTITEAGGGG